MSAGDVIGIVEETKVIKHKIMVPNGIKGTIKTIEKVHSLLMKQYVSLKPKMVTKFDDASKWPVRRSRPIKEN